MAIGGISVLAGSRVLAGIDHPDYLVLPWLVRYNIIAGIVGVVVGAGTWLARPWSVFAAPALAGAHGATLLWLIVLWSLGSAVASQSLAAMAFRTALWIGVALVAGRASRASGC